MGCPKGGSHNFRTERVYKDGTKLVQCRKCSRVEERGSMSFWTIAAIVIAVAAALIGIVVYLENNPLP